MAVNQRHSYYLICDLCGRRGPTLNAQWHIANCYIRSMYRRYGWRRKKDQAGTGKLVDVCAACFLGKKHLGSAGSPKVGND